MQLAQVAIETGGDGNVRRFGGPPRISYGPGLFCEDDPVNGHIVQHSGGATGGVELALEVTESGQLVRVSVALSART
jgi:hypothetical protein